ncbi:MAG TPA: hypothetical protein VFU59_02190 [Candidatus Eisenbacteria bacterium]|nr:hypothetical protein [Candidatus Eisenbacteria bacterium]
MKTRFAVLALLLVVVCIPRFQMWDPGPVGRLAAGAKSGPWGHPIDVEGYERLVQYFRGAAPADSMIAPFCFRPLAPAVASVIPAPPGVAINLVNIASLLLVLLVLERIGLLAGLGSRGRWAAGLLFTLSFPTFYYGAIGFIDPVAILFASIFLLLTLQGSGLLLLIPALVLAVLAKETNAVLALLPLAGAYAGGRWNREAFLDAVVLLATAAGTYILVRAAEPFPGQDVVWLPSLAAAAENLSRPRTYLSLALTIGLPGALAGLALATGRAKATLTAPSLRVLATGTMLAGLLYAYSIFAAYTDGRILWIAYPCLAPIAAAWWEGVRTKK